jgi:hypothetical protein
MKKENLRKKSTKGRRRSTLTTGYIKSYSTTPAFFICLFEKKKKRQLKIEHFFFYNS